MKLLDKLRQKRAMRAQQDPYDTLGTPDTLPADASMKHRLAAGGAMLHQATDYVRKNPKLIGGIALVGAAILANRYRRGHV